MRKATLLLIVFATTAHGQDHLDSLWSTWQDGTHPDTVRLNALNAFIWENPRALGEDSVASLGRMMYDSASHWGQHEFMIAAENTRARLKARQGDHSGAIDHYQHALVLSRETGDVRREIIVLANIGGSYFQMKEPYNALQFFNRALEISGSSEDRAEAHIRTSIALAHNMMGEYEEADGQVRRALLVAERIGDKREILYAARILADNLVSQGHVAEAIPLYERSLALGEESRNEPAIVSALKGASLAHAKRGDAVRAVALGRRSLDMALAVGDRSRTMNSYSNLYEVFKLLKRPADALEMLEQYLEIHDEILNDENKTALVKQKIQHDFDLKEAMLRAEQEKKDAIAAQEIRRQKVVRNSFMAGALLLLSGGGIWFRTDRKRRRERFEKEAAELRTSILRSQMNPHFIFNALNSINAFVQSNDADGASYYLAKFAGVMRGVLENSRHSEVPLQDDLDTLRGYMELERRRMQGKFDFTIVVHEDIDPERVMVPPLVVQPLVENAIWHGIAHKEGPGRIAVQVELQGEQLVWSIEDDGVGLHAARKTSAAPQVQGMKKTSLGTAITRSRLDLLRQQYGGRAGFRYEQLPLGTRVVVDMPLIKA
ncbi:MAG: tetratricopeptide repeat protein [Flavobacteriales bacterium]|nr:tetratricopeptide repeat protein [Flavobacteriales bacterium]